RLRNARAARYPPGVSSRFPLDPVALTAELVSFDSRNPELVPGAPGERAVAERLGEILAGWGCAVSVHDVVPGRTNLIARVGPPGRTPLVLNGHLDVVGTDGMTHAPFDPVRVNGRLYGRGSNDMKGGIAAMCVAAARASARGALASEIVITAVCDEEYRSLGTSALLADGLTATAAIVTEPTRLAVAPAHKGFEWFDVQVHGRAAHGSRPDVGIDAIAHAGLLLAALVQYDDDTLSQRSHALLGHPSIHASTIRGGTGWSTYPDACSLQLERRTIPGEASDDVFAEVQALCDAIARRRPTFRAEFTRHTTQPANDVAVNAPVVRALTSALTAAGQPASVDGLSCWTDAALFTAAGIQAVCFGPGDIARAHAAEEWIDEAELHLATDVLERVVSAWGRDERGR
ncbi:MAG: ArgE/DapE family deacylase, partial [Gemmatimonadaceae bacterium]|nr:ArgE/DapE family deacylase [Gemmatimonadaceae bacterium]